MSYLRKMEEVRLKQPRHGLVAVRNENSPYVSYCGNMKNCYMVSGSEFDEDCYYGFFIYNSKDCVDNAYCAECTLCYDCVDCHGCYNSNYSQDSVNCMDSEYLYDCVGCSKCFGCVGLRHKKEMIFNMNVGDYCKFVLGKDAGIMGYDEVVAEIKKNMSQEQIRAKVLELQYKTPRLFVHQMTTENCTGDYVYNSKNSYQCFDVRDMEDCMYCNNSEQDKDCLDSSNCYYKMELNYEIMAAMELYNCNFCVTCFYSRDLDYCENVHNSKNCFGCFSMNHAEFCIFNEKYTEEEYFSKRAEIIAAMKAAGEYGEFLPSTYSYEDSNATIHWPEG